MSVYFTPGPAQLHPKMEQYMADAFAADIMSISHRDKEFSKLYENVSNNLKKLLNIPQDFMILFTGSATEAMERTLQGLAIKSSQHFVGGAFGEKWYEIAKELNLDAVKIVTPTTLDAKHNYSIKKSADIICLTHNETSTGATMPDSLLLELAKKAKVMEKFVAVDIVSSAPFVSLPWEFVDVAFFSVQKNFGMPAGLGVLIVSPRALAGARHKLEAGHSIGSYHSLISLAASAAKFQTPATPNVIGIYLLDKIVEDFLENIEEIKQKSQTRANTLYELIRNNYSLTVRVENPSWQSNTVIVAKVAEGNAAICDFLSSNQLVIGKGYKNDKDSHIRIANFPAISDESFTRLIELLSHKTT